MGCSSSFCIPYFRGVSAPQPISCGLTGLILIVDVKTGVIRPPRELPFNTLDFSGRFVRYSFIQCINDRFVEICFLFLYSSNGFRLTHFKIC